MRLVLLTSLVMVFFAANSLLNRLALAEGEIGAAEFATVRLFSGAAILLAILAWRDGGRRMRAPVQRLGAAALVVYMLGFSFAYLWLDAGLGALILFGGVQITMFLGAALTGEPMRVRRVAGALIAFAGLVWLLSPMGAAPDPAGAALMAAAAVGWGVYSLRGARAGDPLIATAGNFAGAFPVAFLAAGATAFSAGLSVSPTGAFLAVVSGAVTSGLGYALWYRVLPHLSATAAGVAQLTVPVIALAGGAVLLGETITLPMTLAATIVLGGVALALSGRRA